MRILPNESGKIVSFKNRSVCDVRYRRPATNDDPRVDKTTSAKRESYGHDEEPTLESPVGEHAPRFLCSTNKRR